MYLFLKYATNLLLSPSLLSSLLPFVFPSLPPSLSLSFSLFSPFIPSLPLFFLLPLPLSPLPLSSLPTSFSLLPSLSPPPPHLFRRRS